MLCAGSVCVTAKDYVLTYMFCQFWFTYRPIKYSVLDCITGILYYNNKNPFIDYFSVNSGI